MELHRARGSVSGGSGGDGRSGAGVQVGRGVHLKGGSSRSPPASPAPRPTPLGPAKSAAGQVRLMSLLMGGSGRTPSKRSETRPANAVHRKTVRDRVEAPRPASGTPAGRMAVRRTVEASRPARGNGSGHGRHQAHGHGRRHQGSGSGGGARQLKGGAGILVAEKRPRAEAEAGTGGGSASGSGSGGGDRDHRVGVVTKRKNKGKRQRSASLEILLAKRIAEAMSRAEEKYRSGVLAKSVAAALHRKQADLDKVFPVARQRESKSTELGPLEADMPPLAAATPAATPASTVAEAASQRKFAAEMATEAGTESVTETTAKTAAVPIGTESEMQAATEMATDAEAAAETDTEASTATAALEAPPAPPAESASSLPTAPVPSSIAGTQPLTGVQYWQRRQRAVREMCLAKPLTEEVPAAPLRTSRAATMLWTSADAELDRFQKQIAMHGAVSPSAAGFDMSGDEWESEEGTSDEVGDARLLDALQAFMRELEPDELSARDPVCMQAKALKTQFSLDRRERRRFIVACNRTVCRGYRSVARRIRRIARDDRARDSCAMEDTAEPPRPNEIAVQHRCRSMTTRVHAAHHQTKKGVATKKRGSRLVPSKMIKSLPMSSAWVPLGYNKWTADEAKLQHVPFFGDANIDNDNNLDKDVLDKLQVDAREPARVPRRRARLRDLGGYVVQNLLLGYDEPDVPAKLLNHVATAIGEFSLSSVCFALRQAVDDGQLRDNAVDNQAALRRALWKLRPVAPVSASDSTTVFWGMKWSSEGTDACNVAVDSATVLAAPPVRLALRRANRPPETRADLSALEEGYRRLVLSVDQRNNEDAKSWVGTSSSLCDSINIAERVMDSYHTLYCHRCHIYDCGVHGTRGGLDGGQQAVEVTAEPRRFVRAFSQEEGLSRALQRWNTAFKSRAAQSASAFSAANCGDDCFRKRAPRSAASPNPVPLPPRVVAMLNKLYHVVQCNVCALAALVGQPCWRVHLACQNLGVAEVESTEAELRGEGEGSLLPLMRAFSESADEKSRKHVLASRLKYVTSSERCEFFPCEHEGPCNQTSGCACFERGHFCDKFCSCPLSCPNRFAGCKCTSGCVSRSCPCVSADRECDPDLCRSCGAAAVAMQGAMYKTDVVSAAHCDRCCNVDMQSQDRTRHSHVGLARSDIRGAGWGAFCIHGARKGDFIHEYVGELISQEEGDRRGSVYDTKNRSYLFHMDTRSCIDATRFGNKLRFANHSKSHANCVARVKLVNGDHHVCLQAVRDIEPEEELLFNYGYLEHEDHVAWMLNGDLAGKVVVRKRQPRSKKKQLVEVEII